MNMELCGEKNYFMNFSVVTCFLSTRSVLSPSHTRSFSRPVQHGKGQNNALQHLICSTLFFILQIELKANLQPILQTKFGKQKRILELSLQQNEKLRIQGTASLLHAKFPKIQFTQSKWHSLKPTSPSCTSETASLSVNSVDGEVAMVLPFPSQFSRYVNKHHELILV